MRTLRVPFEISGGKALTVEQATIDEVEQNVRVIVATRRGERLATPDFGTGDPVFDLRPDIADFEAAIERFEPRAVVSITADDDNLDRNFSIRVGMEPL